MVFAGVNYIAVTVAAFAAFGFGTVWYMSLSKPWLAAAGIDPAKMATRDGKQDRSPFIISFLRELFLAWVLAGLIGHMGAVTVSNALISAFTVWAGFMAVPMLINHRYQMLPLRLTLIDSGHWLGVVLIQGLIIGLFGV